MKTKITFWGGLHTIGGNIVEIVYGTDRIIFDFGLVYNPGSSIVDTTTRKNTYVLDLLKLDAIPAIDGIYSKEDLAGPSFSMRKPIPQEASIYQTAVFISHLHLDHMGAMDTISPATGVYMTNESKQLYHTLEEILEGLPFEREVIGLSYGEQIQIGEMKVTPYQVDHDVIGAASYFIETPDMNLLFSGDLRLHGMHPEYIEDWLAEMKEKKIDILLMEGTSFGPEKKKTESLCRKEAEIEDVAKIILQKNHGLALFNMYHRNVERISSFLHAAIYAGRIPVLEPETAYIADQFLEESAFLIFVEEEDQLSSLTKNYQGITLDKINEKPNRYLLQNSYHHIGRLLDLDLTNSVYLHSNGMPLGDFDPAYQTMHAVLQHFGVAYQSLDVSGHATTADMLYMIDQIKPELLIPWHTRHPELMKPLDRNQSVFYPELKKEYIYEDGQLLTLSSVNRY